MKTFDDLTEGLREWAKQKCLDELLGLVASGVVVFDDAANHDDVQARIDRAIAEAERLSAPWFACEIILDDPVVADVLRGIAQCDAEDAIYLEPGEHASYLPDGNGG